MGSGMYKGHSDPKWYSNDKPHYNFGLQYIDDHSIRKSIMTVAPLVPRHYIVMEVKGNLVAADRAENLKTFSASHFKRVAQVVMGEPPNEFKEKVHEQVLKDKQLKSDAAWRRKKAEQERRKMLKQKAKEQEEKKKAAMEEMKKRREAAEAKRKEMIAAAQKKREEAMAKKKAEDDAKKAEEDAKKKEAEGEKKDAEKKEGDDVEMKTEEKKEEATEEKKEEAAAEKKEEAAEEKKEEAAAEKKEDEKKEEATDEKKEDAAEEKKEEEKKEEAPAPMEEVEEDLGDEPPKVELDDEDKKQHFLIPVIKDITDDVLSASFGDFSIPEKSEGFDDVKFEWANASKSQDYVGTWRKQKKITSKIETLEGGEWFTKKSAEFKAAVQEFENKQKAFKAKPAGASKAEPEKKEGED